MRIFEGDMVMITTGKLTSYYGHVVVIYHYQHKEDKALVETMNENNKVTFRRYNLSNLIKI